MMHSTCCLLFVVVAHSLHNRKEAGNNNVQNWSIGTILTIYTINYVYFSISFSIMSPDIELINRWLMCYRTDDTHVSVNLIYNVEDLHHQIAYQYYSILCPFCPIVMWLIISGKRLDGCLNCACIPLVKFVNKNYHLFACFAYHIWCIVCHVTKRDWLRSHEKLY